MAGLHAVSRQFVALTPKTAKEGFTVVVERVATVGAKRASPQGEGPREPDAWLFVSDATSATAAGSPVRLRRVALVVGCERLHSGLGIRGVEGQTLVLCTDGISRASLEAFGEACLVFVCRNLEIRKEIEVSDELRSKKQKRRRSR
jgi:hypothetical protein